MMKFVPLVAIAGLTLVAACGQKEAVDPTTVADADSAATVADSSAGEVGSAVADTMADPMATEAGEAAADSGAAPAAAAPAAAAAETTAPAPAAQ